MSLGQKMIDVVCYYRIYWHVLPRNTFDHQLVHPQFLNVHFTRQQTLPIVFGWSSGCSSKQSYCNLHSGAKLEICLVTLACGTLNGCMMEFLIIFSLSYFLWYCFPNITLTSLFETVILKPMIIGRWSRFFFKHLHN